MKHKHIGSSFESFLEEEGMLDEVAIRAIERLRVSQERLGAEFECVLFDNLWDLYAR